MADRFRKKPVVIEAIQFDGSNAAEITEWARNYGHTITYMEGFTVDLIAIHTLNGRVVARSGEWVIKGINNEFYPCDPGIFAETYQPAEDI